jgi:hypothetical protein
MTHRNFTRLCNVVYECQERSETRSRKHRHGRHGSWLRAPSDCLTRCSTQSGVATSTSCSLSAVTIKIATTGIETSRGRHNRVGETRDADKTRFIRYSGDSHASLCAVESGVFDTLQISVSILDQESIDLAIPAAHSKAKGSSPSAPSPPPVDSCSWCPGLIRLRLVPLDQRQFEAARARWKSVAGQDWVAKPENSHSELRL